MSTELIPARPQGISVRQAAAIEGRMARTIAQLSEVSDVEEVLRRAAALEAYLAGKEGFPHAQGIARRAEARIGELLPPAEEAMLAGKSNPSVMPEGLRDKDLRADFRALAAKVRRGMLRYEDDGEDSPWRGSRRSLLLGNGAFSAEATGEYEWYTPAEVVDLARRVMGGIDLDPASSARANAVIRARRYFTERQDGLAQDWSGRVWLNPPYKASVVEKFCARLCESYAAGDVSQAVTLTYAATETGWFHALAEHATAIAFPRGRIPYWSDKGGGSAPLKGSALCYLGPKGTDFRAAYGAIGITARL